MKTIPAKHIVMRNRTTAWFGAEYNMNIYKGCSHGCIYCDSRSECYGIRTFDEIQVKKRALEIIRDDLRRKVKTGVVATGSMSDPYNPYERTLCLTRHALELISAYEFGAAIATKSSLITRDIDILSDICKTAPVICKITITTYDASLCRQLEPNVSGTPERFDALRTLAGAGIFCGILLMPVLPFINDTERNISQIIEKASDCGARFVYPAFGVTLRQNQREWYFDRLETLFPDEGYRQKYLRTYGTSYECRSPHTKKLWNLFCEHCERTGLLYRMQDIIAAYKTQTGGKQLSFLDETR